MMLGLPLEPITAERNEELWRLLQMYGLRDAQIARIDINATLGMDGENFDIVLEILRDRFHVPSEKLRALPWHEFVLSEGELIGAWILALLRWSGVKITKRPTRSLTFLMLQRVIREGKIE